WKAGVGGSRQEPAVIRIVEPSLTLDLAGHRIDRLDGAAQPVGGPEAAAGEAVARLERAALVQEVLLHLREHVVAAFLGRNVEQAKLRMVRTWFPVLGAEMRWTQLLAVGVGAAAVAARVVLLHVLGGIVVERPPGLRIEAGGPVELVDVLLAGDE